MFLLFSKYERNTSSMTFTEIQLNYDNVACNKLIHIIACIPRLIFHIFSRNRLIDENSRSAPQDRKRN